MGDGPHLAQLIQKRKDLKLENYIEFLGWMPPADIPLMLQKCHVGVIPHVVSPFWNHTIPNKLFDFMLQGVPVLCTSAIPVKRILAEENCGLIISENPYEVADLLMSLKKNLSYLKEMGENGRQAVLKKYNWNKDGALLASAIELQFT